MGLELGLGVMVRAEGAAPLLVDHAVLGHLQQRAGAVQAAAPLPQLGGEGSVVVRVTTAPCITACITAGITAATAAAATAAATTTAAASTIAAEEVRQLVAARVLIVQLVVGRARQVDLGVHLSREHALDRLEHHPYHYRHINHHDALNAHGVAANVQRGELELGTQRYLPRAPASVSQRGGAAAQSGGKGRTLL